LGSFEPFRVRRVEETGGFTLIENDTSVAVGEMRRERDE